LVFESKLKESEHGHRIGLDKISESISMVNEKIALSRHETQAVEKHMDIMKKDINKFNASLYTLKDNFDDQIKNSESNILKKHENMRKCLNTVNMQTDENTGKLKTYGVRIS